MKIRQAVTAAILVLSIGRVSTADPLAVALISPTTDPPDSPATSHTERPVTADLTDDLLGVMNKWTPAIPVVPHADYEAVASDIAFVVHEFGNVWPGGDPVVMARRSGVLLATLAYWEGARFAAYVDDGRCNDWMAEAMRNPIRRPDSKTHVATIFPNYAAIPAEGRTLIHYGDCDGGHAYSLWQVWPKGEFTAEKLRTRRDAARAALLIARASFKLRGNLSGYTGESAKVHPKADEREQFARRYY
jgi:hypothetical protein